MNQYWENLWDNSTITEYMGYVYGISDISSDFIHIFKEHNIKKVCDAACGYGKYSALLYSEGFEVFGFDIAESSIHLTKQILHFLGMDSILSNYIITDVVKTPYMTEEFDAIVAHAIIDHLPRKSATLAIEELLRITKKDGLLYLSFCGNNESNNSNSIASYDGNFPLQSLDREGHLYHYYSDEEIKNLLAHDCKIINYTVNEHGDRDIILQK